MRASITSATLGSIQDGTESLPIDRGWSACQSRVRDDLLPPRSGAPHHSPPCHAAIRVVAVPPEDPQLATNAVAAVGALRSQTLLRKPFPLRGDPRSRVPSGGAVRSPVVLDRGEGDVRCIRQSHVDQSSGVDRPVSFNDSHDPRLAHDRRGRGRQ